MNLQIREADTELCSVFDLAAESQVHSFDPAQVSVTGGEQRTIIS